MASLDRFEVVFAALADPNRRAVLERLAVGGEESATSLAAAMPISRQAVIKHLNHLNRAQLVKSRRFGKEVLYSARSELLRQMGHDLEMTAAMWDRQLEALKRIAEAVEAVSESVFLDG